MAIVNGNRALFGYVNGHGVLLERFTEEISPPTAGYAMTKAAYDALGTYETGKYYALYDEATTSIINYVEIIDIAEYDASTALSTTLYILTDENQGGLIVDARLGADYVEQVYIADSEYWSRYEYVASKELTDTVDSVSYQTIWNAIKTIGGWSTDKYYIYPNGTYNSKPRFMAYKLESSFTGNLEIGAKSSGSWKSKNQYYMQNCDVKWDSRLSYWEASTSTATGYVYLPDIDYHNDNTVCTSIPIIFTRTGIKITPHS